MNEIPVTILRQGDEISITKLFILNELTEKYFRRKG